MENAIIQHIMGNPILSSAVEEMVRRTGALNLVRPDWELTLKDSEVYQRHAKQQIRYSKGRDFKSGVNIRSVIGANNHYQLIVVGSFTLTQRRVDPLDPDKIQDTAFMVRNCPPLQSVAQSMLESPDQKMQDNCKLFVERCNVGICNTCNQYKQLMHGPDDNWCLATCRIFDGSQIRNAFKSKIEEMFGALGNFIGILNLNVNSRVKFGENSAKIGGNIKEFIIFKESVLMPRNEMVINPYLEPHATPTVTYPQDLEEIENAIPMSVSKKIKDDTA